MYYIQNVYSEYYMQVADGRTTENTLVSHMDKNLGNEDVDDSYYLSVEFDLRNMWKIQYYGNLVDNSYVVYLNYYANENGELILCNIILG